MSSITMKWLRFFKHRNSDRMQISCNVPVQSITSSVVVIATNQTPVGINTYHKVIKSLIKRDTEFETGLQAPRCSN